MSIWICWEAILHFSSYIGSRPQQLQERVIRHTCRILSWHAWSKPELPCFGHLLCNFQAFRCHSVFMQYVYTFALSLYTCDLHRSWCHLRHVASTLSISVFLLVSWFGDWVVPACALGRVERQVQNHHHSGTSNQRCRHSWGVLKPNFGSLAQPCEEPLLEELLSVFPFNPRIDRAAWKKSGLVKIERVERIRTKCRVGKRGQWSKHVHMGMENEVGGRLASWSNFNQLIFSLMCFHNRSAGRGGSFEDLQMQDVRKQRFAEETYRC